MKEPKDQAAPGSGKSTIHPLEIRLEGELTVPTLLYALAPVDEVMRAHVGAIALVVDASEMTGYATDARGVFIDWNAEHRDRIHRVAVVTRRIAWRMVVLGIGLASRQQIRPFTDRMEAHAWACRRT